MVREEVLYVKLSKYYTRDKIYRLGGKNDDDYQLSD